MSYGVVFPNLPRRAAWIAGTMAAAVAGMTAAAPREPTGPDQRWSDAMAVVHSAPLDHAAHALDRTGRGAARGLTIAGIAVLAARRPRLDGLVAFGLAEALTPAAVNLIKLWADRHRPPAARLRARGSSFPSGHAAYAAATLTAVALLPASRLGRPGRQAVWLGVVAGSAAMAWSRTYLQVHWLSDVAAGALLGGAVTLATFDAVDHVRGR
jgi:undecaprenyl-diphosphatase